MFEYKFKIYINGVWFDSLYGIDYYYDKRMFFSAGAKRFFTIYQILRNEKYEITVVEENGGAQIGIKNTEEFEKWVEQNYGAFLNYLDDINWSDHPESNLKL